MIDLCYRFFVEWPKPPCLGGGGGLSWFMSFSCPFEMHMFLARPGCHSSGVVSHRQPEVYVEDIPYELQRVL